MRRVLAVLVTGVTVVAIGCSSRYDKRMDLTLAEMQYNKRLDDNLKPAPAEGKLKDLQVYIRPPQPMVEAKEFGLGVLPTGLYDVEKTFYDADKSALHVIARVKTPKKAPAKGAAPAEPPAPRGAFNSDVLGTLKAVYGDDDSISLDKFKDDSHKPLIRGSENKFRRAVFPANNKTVEVYFFTADTYNVAMIFVYNTADRNAIVSKINLCLESFATGNRARAKYSSGGSEEGAEESAGPGVAF